MTIERHRGVLDGAPATRVFAVTTAACAAVALPTTVAGHRAPHLPTRTRV